MINIIGNILDSSGYSRHTRELSNSLSKITEVSLQSNLIPGWERMVNDSELEMIKRETDHETNLIITNPMFWRVNCTANYNIAYLVWEGDCLPIWMAKECANDNIHKIIVPSQHTKDALMETWDELEGKPEYMENKVVTIPHGVDLEKFYPIHTGGAPKILEDGIAIDNSLKQGTNVTLPFKFLMCKGFTNMEDRGGVQYGIQAYLKEFTKKDNVELIIKLNSAYGIPDFNKLFPELTKKDNPKITLITETLDDKQLNQLYNDCDVFVSPTRAESFNLPCLEALACGKPVLTSNFGGQTDFIEPGKEGFLIDGKLTEVTWDLFYEGIKWLTPSIKELRKQLRFSFENRDRLEYSHRDYCLARAKSLTWDNTALMINNITKGKSL